MCVCVCVDIHPPLRTEQGARGAARRSNSSWPAKLTLRTWSGARCAPMWKSACACRCARIDPCLCRRCGWCFYRPRSPLFPWLKCGSVWEVRARGAHSTPALRWVP